MARRRAAVSPAATAVARFTTIDWIVLAGVAIAAIVVFFNGMNGEFVYDDLRQIEQNPLIQDSSRIGEALTSDVWSFRSTDDEPASNYWRPTFVLWLILNYSLFGLNATSWHIVNLLLHLVACGLAYGVLRQLGAGRWIAFAITLLFAVHPAHVETVTWISGSPDLLMTVPFLGAWWLYLSNRETPKPWKLPVAWVLMAISLFSKESAVLLPVILGVSLFIEERRRGATNEKAAVETGKQLIPVVVIAVLYFILRLMVVGQFSQTLPWQWTVVDYILTIPSIFVFYLRQSFFPILIGPSYPLRPVTPATIGLMNFFVPLVITVIAAVALWWIARRGKLQTIGAALFLIPLAPTFHINAFLFEQIVHDRYLYLPLLGILMMVVPTIVELLNINLSWESDNKGRILLAGVVLYAILLGVQTIRYNPAWTSDLNLWSWAIQSDDTSAFNWREYGRVMIEENRLDEAKTALDRSLTIVTSVPALISRADLAILESRNEDAYNDLQAILERQPNNVDAIQRLAIVYQNIGRLPDAITLLSDARERVPQQRCIITTNLAVAYYASGNKQQALTELEANRAAAESNPHPDCRLTLLRLGQLYYELGRVDEGRLVLNDFLVLTQSITDSKYEEFHQIAEDLLAS